MKEEQEGLEKLKEDFEKLKVKHDLPSFYDLNKFFDIEEISHETEFLLRKIRRTISEKISNYLRFIEIIINPSNAPVFFFKLVKKLDKKDQEILSEIYGSIGNLEIEIISLDLDYSEEKEAEFIKKIFKLFNEEIRIKFESILQKLLNEETNNKKSSNGSYFG